MLILPIHFGTAENYEALKERKRRSWADPDSVATRRYFDRLYPYWFYNDIAGFVEFRVEGSVLRYKIFLARSDGKKSRWTRDRRARVAYMWCDRNHVSLERCKTRKDYVAQAERALRMVTKTIPKKLTFSWEEWKPLLKSIDWRALVRTTTTSG